MKCLDGELQETRYEWPAITDDGQDHEMVVKSKGLLKKNELAYINGTILNFESIFSSLSLISPLLI